MSKAGKPILITFVYRGQSELRGDLIMLGCWESNLDG